MRWFRALLAAFPRLRRADTESDADRDYGKRIEQVVFGNPHKDGGGDAMLMSRMPDPRGRQYNTYIYFCPKCGQQLSAGPEGGASVNVVCKPCHINYGCLPGYYGF